MLCISLHSQEVYTEAPLAVSFFSYCSFDMDPLSIVQKLEVLAACIYFTFEEH